MTSPEHPSSGDAPKLSSDEPHAPHINWAADDSDEEAPPQPPAFTPQASGNGNGNGNAALPTSTDGSTAPSPSGPGRGGLHSPAQQPQQQQPGGSSSGSSSSSSSSSPLAPSSGDARQGTATEKGGGAGDSEDEDGEEESAEDELDSLNDHDGLEDEGEPSMDEEEYSRHCRQRTISTNRGHRRAAHDIRGCRSVDNFLKLNLINEGTYGRVWRAQQTLRNGRTKINALKQVKMEREKEGFPLTALREINVLLTLQHPNVVNVEEVVVGTKADNIFLVMEYVEHDLKYLMETMKARFSQAEIKCLLVQLLAACNYMHDNWVIHRDLKTSNLLYANNGVLKVCDFGLARLYGDPVKKMTPLVVTLWYRSPEILLGEDSYTPVVDMWSVGCIFAELLQKEPLFPGKTELDQLNKIFAQMGTPTAESWPEFDELPSAKKQVFTPVKGTLRETFPPSSMYSDRTSLTENGFDLLSRLLSMNPKNRITAADAMNHPYFIEVPPPQEVSMMPTFKPTNEEPRCHRKKRKKGADDPNRETKMALGVA